MVKDIKKERRRFEDELRKSLLKLLNQGLEEEAEDLIFRLRQKMAEKMALYYKENESLMKKEKGGKNAK